MWPAGSPSSIGPVMLCPLVVVDIGPGDVAAARTPVTRTDSPEQVPVVSVIVACRRSGTPVGDMTGGGR